MLVAGLSATVIWRRERHFLSSCIVDPVLHHDAEKVVGSWFGSNSVALPTDHSTGGSHYSPVLQMVAPCLLLTLEHSKMRRKRILTEINCKHQGGLPLAGGI